MKNVEDILYSLLPLLVVIVISWFLSYLGARNKKVPQTSQTATTTPQKEQLFDLFTVREDEPPAESAEPRTPDPRGTTGPAWQAEMAARGPQPTPKPITPRWWGA